MNETASATNGPVPVMARHRLPDWLTMHGLTAATCEQLLDMIPFRQPPPAMPPTAYPALTVAAAWETAQRALRRLFLAQARIIGDTFEGMETIQLARTGARRRAVTLDNGIHACPTILYSYDGDPEDLLMIAHEFGHAVQLRMSEGRFVPPMIRETCAFLVERALLAETHDSDPICHRHLVFAAWADDERYLGGNRNRLRQALTRPDAPYRYTWNYPIARYLAHCLDRCSSPDQRLALFRGQLSVPDLIGMATG